MSRASYSNAKYTLAFGVDHTPMGTFFQVWDKGFQDEFDTPIVQFDAMHGVQIKSPEHLAANPRLARQLEWLRLTFEPPGSVNLAANHVIDIARALDLYSPELERKVYELWD